jgi:3-phenylpropionate/cinnamic acid dioxygenase small subunit
VAEPTALDQIDALQLEYLRSLDRRDMAAWEGCFGETASYTCTTAESEDQGLPVALMLDDSRQRIADRVGYVTKIWAGTFEDYRTRHFVQRLSCTALPGSRFEVESQFLVAYTTARGQSELLTTGLYFDVIVLDAAGARFLSKKAVLDTAVTPRYLVYPI